MISVNLESYNIGDNVWFYDYQTGKYIEGKITIPISWNKWDGWNIEVEHYDEKGKQLLYNVEEKNIFHSKEDILIDLFKENGMPNSNDE